MIADQEPLGIALSNAGIARKSAAWRDRTSSGRVARAEITTSNHSLHRLRLRSRYQSRRQIARQVRNFELHHLIFGLIIGIRWPSTLAFRMMIT